MAEVKKENWFSSKWNQTKKFFREIRSELKKVVWPTKEQVLKNALIVAGCVLVVGLFIWLFDFFAQVLITGLIDLALELKALKKAGREDLIGYGKECLVRPLKPENTQNFKGGNKKNGTDNRRKKSVGKNQRRTEKRGGKPKGRR